MKALNTTSSQNSGSWYVEETKRRHQIDTKQRHFLFVIAIYRHWCT